MLRRSRFFSLWRLAFVSFEAKPHLPGVACPGMT
jgi:hypothetical protein